MKLTDRHSILTIFEQFYQDAAFYPLVANDEVGVKKIAEELGKNYGTIKKRMAWLVSSGEWEEAGMRVNKTGGTPFMAYRKVKK